MKARALQKRLGTTRTVHLSGGKVCIASAYIHDLIGYDIQTKNIRLALSSTDRELIGLRDALQAMADSGEILEYVDGEDELSQRIPVYSWDNDGNIIERFTDKLGWPNVTADGVRMYDNTHFASKKDAITKAIAEFRAGVSIVADTVKDAERDLSERKSRLEHYEACLAKLIKADH